MVLLLSDFHRMEQILRWLKGKQPYNEGYQLLKQHGTNQTIIKLLEGQETIAKQKILLRAIQDLVKALPMPTAKEETKVLQHISSKTIDSTTKASEALNELKSKAKEVLKERDQIHARLKFYKSIEERGQAAHKLLDLDDEIDALYDKIRQVEKTGTAPEEELPFVPITDPSKWEHRYQTCGRYVRRYQDRLGKVPGDEVAQLLLKKYEAEQLYYAKKLNKWA